LVPERGADRGGTASWDASALWCFQRPSNRTLPRPCFSSGRTLRGNFHSGGHAYAGGISERAVKAVREMDADCTVAIGGGSTTGLGKPSHSARTSRKSWCNHICRSEKLRHPCETRDGRKTTQRSEKVLPEVILYDVDLTLTLPPGLSATSGIAQSARQGFDSPLPIMDMIGFASGIQRLDSMRDSA